MLQPREILKPSAKKGTWLFLCKKLGITINVKKYLHYVVFVEFILLL